MQQLIGGAVLAAAVALGARRARSLTQSGSLAAFITGTCVFGAGGWPYAAVLFSFFIPSTVLSRIGRFRKQQLVDIGKHGARDAWQVAANGGIAAVCAVLAALTHRMPIAAAFAGAFAAASADTWGTEIGTLAKGLPRSILTFKPLPPGISGGITFQGTLAEIAGALFVGLVASALHVAPWWAVTAGGITGAFADSLLGATVQELRYCAACARSCETNPHICGAPTTVIRGSTLMSNDAVNFCATLTGAIVALALSL